MMRKNSNISIFSVAIILMAVSGLSSVSAKEGSDDTASSSNSWQERRDAMEQRREDRKAVSDERKSDAMQTRCEAILKNRENMLARLGDQADNFSERKSQWREKWQEHVTKADETLNVGRDKTDQRREEMYAKMLGKATTDEQKTAITKFQQTVEAAVKERRASVDKAITDFRAEAVKVRDSKKTVNDVAVAQFKKDVEAALAQVKSDCDAQKDPKTVQETLRASLKTAQEKFRAARKSDEVPGQQIKVLVEARQAEVKAAMVKFQSQLEVARTALKLALGSGTKPTPTVTPVVVPTSTPAVSEN